MALLPQFLFLSTKPWILCAIALYLDCDNDKAVEIYQSLNDTKEKYLLQGEVKSDLAIMDWMLSPNLKESSTEKTTNENKG